MSYHAVNIWSDDYVAHVSLLQDCDEAHTKWKKTRLCLIIEQKDSSFRKCMVYTDGEIRLRCSEKAYRIFGPTVIPFLSPVDLLS